MNPAIANRQTEAAECGLACLAMAAAMKGSTIDLGWLRQRHQASARGSSLKDLSEIASSIGMTARALRCEVEDVPGLQRGSILHWGMRHFVVLDSVRRGRIRVFDPASGHRAVSAEELSERFSGVALELTVTTAFMRRPEKSPLKLSSVLQWTPDVRATLAQGLLLSVLLQVYVLAAPFYMQLAIDEAAPKSDAGLLGSLAVAFAIFALLNAGAEALRGLALQRLTSLLSWSMTQRLFHHLIRLPLPWFQRRRLADALSRFQSIEPIKNLIANGLVGALIDGSLSIMTLILMFVFSPALAAVTCAGLAIYIVVRLAGVPLTRRLASEALQASITEQGKKLETLRAMQTIKVMSGEAQREGIWANKFADTVRTTQANGIATMAFSAVQRLFEALTAVAVIYLGIRSVMAGHMTVGLLYAFLSYRGQFVSRFASLFDQVVSWRMLDIYTFRLADIVLTPTESSEAPSPSGLQSFKGGIELDHVSFRYGPTDPFVLKDVSARIEPGEFVAIVGPSGTGKSTLLKVLCGLYPPTYGEVRLDGLPLNVWGPKLVRRSLGAVMQDDELLPGSIAENVSFFDEDCDMDRVWECLEQAAMGDEVRAMQMRAETFVGDMGSTLSGGQKQRVLLARALYKQPKLLVLDEATSHLDLARERVINDALTRLQITRIVVAHRPETIRVADRILHLKGGLVELKAIQRREAAV